MESVNGQRDSSITSMDGSNNINSIDASNTKSTIKDDNSSLTSNESADVKTVALSKQSVTSDTPPITTSSSSTTDSDLESDQEQDQDQDQEEPTKENGKKGKKKRGGPSKREKHFRKVFSSEITDTMPKLIDCYVCAYQGDILLQGKMYITDRYLCFYSRIINYVTKHVYRWEQIERISKERVAYIFPTAIGIKLKELRRKVIYASFLSRDMAHDKITYMWSQFSNNTSSSIDDESSLGPDGTLRPSNKSSRRKSGKRNSYDSVQVSEPDEVLQICLNGNDSNRKRSGSVSPKLRNERFKASILANSSTEKSTEKNSNSNPKKSNQVNTNMDNIDKNTRYPRGVKLERYIDNKATKRSRSLAANTQPIKASSIITSTDVTDQALSLPGRTVSHSNPAPSSSSLPLMSNTNPSQTNLNDIGFPTKLFGLTVSFINLIIQTISSLIHRFRIPPTKTTTFIILFVSIVFFHSFYLITLAYRLENRLQSLHSRWPSSFLKNAFPSK